jgi:hypothetical protein
MYNVVVERLLGIGIFLRKAAEGDRMSAVDSVKERIERRPKQAVLVTAIVAVLIGGVIGLAVGYKVEHDRKASNKSSKTTKTTVPKTTKSPGGGAAATNRAEGTVTATASGSITIKTVQGSSVKLNLSTATVVDKAAKGTHADVTTGRHVLVKAPGVEVIVLRTGSKDGRAVTAISPTSMGLAAGNGLPAGTVKLSDATVIDKVNPATAADVKTGDRIIALGATGSPAVRDVDLVIILPASSKFAA